MKGFMLVTVILFALPIITIANPTSDARKAITAEINRCDTAFKHGDIAGGMADLTPDYYSYGGVDGTMSREQLYEKALQLVPRMHIILYLTDVLQFQLLSNHDALMTVRQRIVVMENTGSRNVPVGSNTTIRDYWVKTATGWRMKQSRTLSAKTIVDGRQIN